MIGVIGAGAFGTALAIALSRDGRDVKLWARNTLQISAMNAARQNTARLPGAPFPNSLDLTSNIDDLRGSDALLISLPMQALRCFLNEHRQLLDGHTLVACCKGVDLASLKGATELMAGACPLSPVAVLTGPSFAADIARGLPTALTLATPDGTALQHLLSTPNLRLYRTTDVIGAELGGALKNVIAIAAGVVIGAGLGDSARAALMTRGYAEMTRLALVLGAKAETLAGLSGFGDLVLTCTSVQSRNFRYGQALGGMQPFDPTATVEGVATAKAVANLAGKLNVDMPITTMIAALIEHEITLADAMLTLMSRPLKPE